MSYGLQVRDSSGNLRLDINDRTPRLISITAVTVPSGNTTSTITLSGATTSSTVVLDSGAIAEVTAANTVKIYGSYTGGTTNLRLLEF